MKLIFAGTPDFAAPTLQALLDSPHEVMAVYTQPDRPAGRGRKAKSSPVKQLATTHQLPIHQPISLKAPDTQQQLAAYEPDLLIVVAYGLLLPKAVLAIPRLGCLNVHASLLPRWRGAAPIQHAILAGDPQTGVSIMQMEAGLDTGPVLFTQACDILPNDTTASLFTRLATLGANALLASLDNVTTLLANAIAQDATKATHAKKIQKADARIDWQQSAKKIDRKIRAYTPWPIAETTFNGNRVRIHKAQLSQENYSGNQQPGCLLSINPATIDILTGDGILQLTQVQLPNRPVVTVSDLINSNSINLTPGACFQ